MNINDLVNDDQSWSVVEQKASRNSAKKIRNSAGIEGFFKTPPLHVLANEVLAYIFADNLGLPCAKVKFAKLFQENNISQVGVISFRVSGFEPIDWEIVPSDIRGNPKKFIMNGQDLAKIGVFDVWSYNMDRGSTANLVISRKEEWSRKYGVYMIDHEESFYGLPDTFSRNENDNVWYNVNSFIRINEIKQSIKFSDIEEFITDIESLNDDQIRNCINIIPDEYYSAEKKDIVFNLLSKRRGHIRKIMEDWCKQENKL